VLKTVLDVTHLKHYVSFTSPLSNSQPRTTHPRACQCNPHVPAWVAVAVYQLVRACHTRVHTVRTSNVYGHLVSAFTWLSFAHHTHINIRFIQLVTAWPQNYTATLRHTGDGTEWPHPPTHPPTNQSIHTLTFTCVS
jgi:hypothetical protein